MPWFFRKEMLLLETLLIQIVFFFFLNKFQGGKRKHSFMEEARYIIFLFIKKNLILGLFEEGRFYLFIYFFKGEHFKRREKVFKMIFKKKKFIFENNFWNGIKPFEKSFSFGKANFRDSFTETIDLW